MGYFFIYTFLVLFCANTAVILVATIYQFVQVFKKKKMDKSKHGSRPTSPNEVPLKPKGGYDEIYP
jgi:hypothetical protein